ncbi:hypothetical protein ISCGN_004975 [Ixodes scapularis]
MYAFLLFAQAIGSDASLPAAAPAAVENGKVLPQNKSSKPFDPMLLVPGILLSVLFILILTFATLLLRRRVTPDRLCNSADCRLVASVLNSSLNRRVQPCDDFYTFVCGSLQGPERDVIRQDLKKSPLAVSDVFSEDARSRVFLLEQR